MFEIEENRRKVQSAFLIGIQRPGMPKGETEALLDELAELVQNLDIGVVGRETARLRQPNPAFLTGKGQTQSLLETARRLGADALVFDEDLSPAQQRNWERLSSLCVIDRQEVIIDIFSERARTREARLQVELARMEYSLPRLRRAWTHLSRQRGGLTGARGQGETQLETDQRLVRERIAAVKRDLEGVAQRRDVQRAKRLRKPVPTVALVGYTNAGKSSLLNRLAGARLGTEDKLFATLDPATRRLELSRSQYVLLTDTVGFVRRLPHRLVDAFKATLEEAVVADLLLHVIDAASPDIEARCQTTMDVLAEIGADKNAVLTVYNKADQLADCDRERRLRHDGGLLVSAATGEGIEALKARIAHEINQSLRPSQLLLPHDRYDVVSKLHDSGGIRRQEARDEGVYIEGLFPHSLQGVVEPFRTG